MRSHKSRVEKIEKKKMGGFRFAIGFGYNENDEILYDIEGHYMTSEEIDEYYRGYSVSKVVFGVLDKDGNERLDEKGRKLINDWRDI